MVDLPVELEFEVEAAESDVKFSPAAARGSRGWEESVAANHAS